MADGHLNKCKSCTKKDVAEHRERNIERIKEYDRNRPNKEERNERLKEAQKIRMKDPEYRENANKRKKDWLDRNTVKKAAHIITGNAIRDGKLIRSPCEKCGNQKVDAHHDDYEKPLNVRWLCRKCHAQHHKLARDSKRIADKGSK